MATTRIATQPRVPRSPKSAKIPHGVDPNDPMLAKARAFAETIRQLEFGRTLKNPVKLPVVNKEGTDFLPDAFPIRPKRAKPPERSKIPPALSSAEGSKVEGRKLSHRRQSSAAEPPDLARHRRKCNVCNHPDREEIEEQFLHWRRPGDIAYDFDLEDDRYIHRHAHAVGLYARRRENYLFTLENLLERGDEIELTASAYIKAVRAYACMSTRSAGPSPPSASSTNTMSTPAPLRKN